MRAGRSAIALAALAAFTAARSTGAAAPGTRDDNLPDARSYHDADAGEVYESCTRYYDFDRDGFYDAYVTYSDLDGDGVYDEYRYKTLNNTDTEDHEDRASTEIVRQSRQRTTTGMIQETRMVQVPGGQRHVLVAIQPESLASGLRMVADLGAVTPRKTEDLGLGQKITVKGPVAMPGKQPIILASSFELHNVTRRVDRTLRSIEGTVVSTRRVKVRGSDHVMATVNLGRRGAVNDGGDKVAVDLGSADRLGMNVAHGAKFTIFGYPVKVNDEPVMFAESIKVDGETVPIHREAKRNAAQPATKSP